MNKKWKKRLRTGPRGFIVKSILKPDPFKWAKENLVSHRGNEFYKVRLGDTDECKIII